MKYPPPFQKEFFAYEEIINTVKAPEKIDFSRAKPCTWFQEYIDLVHKYGRLRRSLPYIEAIYLSDSITFNSLKENSDIDLFVVTASGRVWSAKLWSSLFLWILWMKRSRKKKKQKFSVNFYVSKDALNLQSIKLAPGDPYLIYWLAHLVVLYQRLPDQSIDIYEENYRLRDYLPSFPMEQTISLWNDVFTGVKPFKRGFEKLFWGIVGDMLEAVVKYLWLPVLLWRKKRLWARGDAIILSDKMLKFHLDKRKEYAVKWKVMNRKKRGKG